MSERLRLAVSLAGAFVLLWLAVPAGVGATHHGEGVIDEVAMRLAYQAAPVAGVPAQLVAHLAMDDGEPIAGMDVEFLRQVEFLGTRQISLGHATSDANGDARLAISGISDTSITVVARCTGDEHYNPTEQTQLFQLPPARPDSTAPVAAPAPSLSAISTVMPSLLMATVLTVWAVLLGLSAVTVLAVRRGRQSTEVRKQGRSKA